MNGLQIFSILGLGQKSALINSVAMGAAKVGGVIIGLFRKLPPLAVRACVSAPAGQWAILTGVSLRRH